MFQNPEHKDSECNVGTSEGQLGKLRLVKSLNQSSLLGQEQMWQKTQRRTTLQYTRTLISSQSSLSAEAEMGQYAKGNCHNLLPILNHIHSSLASVLTKQIKFLRMNLKLYFLFSTLMLNIFRRKKIMKKKCFVLRMDNVKI